MENCRGTWTSPYYQFAITMWCRIGNVERSLVHCGDNSSFDVSILRLVCYIGICCISHPMESFRTLATSQMGGLKLQVSSIMVFVTVAVLTPTLMLLFAVTRMAFFGRDTKARLPYVDVGVASLHVSWSNYNSNNHGRYLPTTEKPSSASDYCRTHKLCLNGIVGFLCFLEDIDQRHVGQLLWYFFRSSG